LDAAAAASKGVSNMPSVSPLRCCVVTIAELFRDARYVPAAIQRDYQWGASECEILMADLDRVFQPSQPVRAADDEADAADEDEVAIESDLLPDPGAPTDPFFGEYYLGAFVVRRLGDGRTEVFDGLQRLTTLTVLLAVLRDLTRDAAQQAELQELIACTEGQRLVMPGRDRTLFEEIQTPGEAVRVRPGSPRTELARRIRTAARTFRKELATWPVERRRDFIDFLLTHVRAVVVEAEEPKLARQIFITTNLRGIPLDQSVLFKGQVIDIAPDEEAAAEMVRHWAGIQQAIGKDLESFLIAMDFMERCKQQGADCLAQLADHLSVKPGPGGILNWTRRLALYAGAWRELMLKMQSPRLNATDVNIWRLRFFKWNEWKPLALLWYADAFIKRTRGRGGARVDALLARRFEALHRRCMAVTLADYSDRARAAIFGRAIRQALRGLNPLNGALVFNAPSQSRMRETLSRPLLDDKIRLTLIRWYESTLWGDSPPPDLAKATVEHVLPRRPGLGSQWLADFDDEGARYDSCHSLGNLAVMDYDKNVEIENFDFLRKKPVITEQSRKYRTLIDVAAAEVWTPEAVEARNARLFKSIWEELQLPEGAPMRLQEPA
jgi:hypothetical protein